MKDVLKAIYWQSMRLARGIGFAELGPGCRIAWRAAVHGGRGRITLGSSCWLDAESVLDARGGGTIRLGDHAQIHRYACLLTYGGDIRLGRNCSVNPFTVLYGHGGLAIGDNVRIAAHVVVIPANHRFDDLAVPIARQGIAARGVAIEDDVWIGAGARILDGCRIGKGAVVGAGAVVTHDVRPYSVVAGVPARHIKSRTE